LSPGVKLCNALQGMGTTFIKLGQFLATRPDIIGEDIAKELEKLQDKLPPFQLEEAKNILRKEIEKENFDKIKNFSDSIAAASIAQVHFAKINGSAEKKEVAIKILRPNIEKIFNEEFDALMLLAYIIESLIKKTKRLKLVEVVQLLREITNLEMDLRFEAAAANELDENTKNVVLVEYPRKGSWAVGFATRENKGEISKKSKQNLVNVFVPTTPNPTSGFLLMFPKEEVIYLDMSFEEASRFIVSAGSSEPK